MSDAAESVILCEGYDDRSFWQGWLLHRGCTDLRDNKGTRHAARGGFTYRTPRMRVLHVIPCQQEARPGSQRDAVRNAAMVKLKDRQDKPLAHLVLNLDVDTRSPDDLRDSIRSLVGPEAKETPDGDFLLDEGEIVVSPLLWHVVDAGHAGVPAQQSLERIVCAALCQARPAWGDAVSTWLDERPDKRGKEHKARAWSFMAGWFTDHGMGHFYASLWQDPDIRVALDDLLKAAGVSRIVDVLVG